MKIIGKSEQKKIELQIESLQKKVHELEAKLDFKSRELDSKHADLIKAQAAVKSEAVSAKARFDDQAKLYNLASQENELLLAQLLQVQEDLERVLSDKKQLEIWVVKIQTDAKNQAEELQKDAKQFQVKATKLSSNLDVANSELSNLKRDLAKVVEELTSEQKSNKAFEIALAELRTDKEKYQQQAQAAQILEAELAKLKTELLQSRKSKLELDTLLSRAMSELELLREETAQQISLQTGKLQEVTQENELLLMQLMQVQEELDTYYLEKIRLEKLTQENQARWERLAERQPNFLDFGSIEIVDVDGLSDVPAITWQVKDFIQAGIAMKEFSFVTVLQDGHPGIGLVKDGQHQVFVPKLLNTQKDQLAIFLELGTTEFKQLTAVINILDQFETAKWKGFEFPDKFDLSFWRPSIQTLVAQLKQLPALLRYDEVRLKRELINPDYEHLWLEFHSLSLGLAHWKKFEIRLGAALVQLDGFSQHPKFEIPLIEGKTKPFESWYAESQDDSGAKLELRFALDKKVFDASVLAKLADSDKTLLLRLIYAIPNALKRLEKQKTSIYRPWASWIDFAAGAVKVLEANKAAAKLPAPEQSQLQANATPNAAITSPDPALKVKVPVPAKLTSTGAKAGKVISITTKPIARSANTIVKPSTKTARKANK